MSARKYIRWMAVNSWATSTSSVISTNSMLNSIMNSPSYTSVIATTYVGKDIIGQLGGLGYAWRTGKKADQQPMKYVTKGALIQQGALFLENFSILITNKTFVLPFLGLSSTMKNVSFISMGAVNANNLQKLSSGNIGEFYSKVASINTLSSTLGMITGIGIIHMIPSYTVRTMLIMPLLGIVSIYSLRQATKLAGDVSQIEKV
jgi:hypothetical protein